VLERMKVLAAESMSGAVGASERAYIDSEYQTLKAEITLIGQTTTFNGVALLDGVYDEAFLVGTDAADVINVDLTGSGLAAVTALLTGDLLTQGTAATELTAINNGIDALAQARANVGAMQSQFSYHADQISVSEENLDAAQSAIMDADIAEAQSDFSSAQVLTNAAISALSQANSMPQQLLKLLQ